MDIVAMVLVFLLAVVASASIARLLPVKVPLPLLQIAIGACLSLAGFNVAFDSHLFLLLFIPPLLFLDGWRIPKGAFFRDWKPILALATGLVVFTVVGLGYFIHWLIPAAPLAAAFALAAILSPTDPVAVSAMTANAPLPSRLMHILEGESLLNDATGLVCFSFAVTATLTGSFSLASATVNFLWVACGGVMIGGAVTWAIGRLNRMLVRHSGEEPAIQIIISLLMPFAAYLVAESAHVSGILAAVAAGMAMHYVELSGRALPATRMQRRVVWDTVQIILNGIIFVLLGNQLPDVLRDLPRAAAAADAGGAWRLAGYAALITLMLSMLRFAWVWISIRLTVFRAMRRGETRAMPQTRLLAVTATAGVRGAITLAGILTLPLSMPNGAAFPAREAMIVLAMGVILLSLCAASIGLPLLVRGLDADLPQSVRRRSEGHARTAAFEAAIRRIEHLVAEPLDDPGQVAIQAQAGMHVLDIYRRRLDYGDPGEQNAPDMQRLVDAERRLRLEGLRAERDELYRLRLTGSIDDAVHQQLLREIDLMEASLTSTSAH
jgi:CPA1 family monovalent cation:H+ antiporter